MTGPTEKTPYRPATQYPLMYTSRGEEAICLHLRTGFSDTNGKIYTPGNGSAQEP